MQQSKKNLVIVVDIESRYYTHTDKLSKKKIKYDGDYMADIGQKMATYNATHVGQPPKYPPIEQQPFIGQLSWMLIDPDTLEPHEFYSAYITPRPESLDLFRMTSFTPSDEAPLYQQLEYKERCLLEKCQQFGEPIVDVLHRYYQASNKASDFISHNSVFDRSLLVVERIRNYEALRAINPAMTSMHAVNKLTGKRFLPEYCTMRHTAKFCKLPRPQEPTKLDKPPSQSELYRILFNEDMPGPSHNAVVDLLACLRCYLKFKEGRTIHSAKFRRMLEAGYRIAHIDKNLMRHNLMMLTYKRGKPSQQSLMDYYGNATKA